jgi:DNA-binding response OmpR family regulator
MELRAKIARVLQPAGYAVELAASEKRALELIADGKIETAIVVPSSGPAGLAFARELGDRVPRLILLAERAGDMAILGRSLPGVDVHLLRPLDVKQLIDRLARAIARSDEPTAGMH